MNKCYSAKTSVHVIVTSCHTCNNYSREDGSFVFGYYEMDKLGQYLRVFFLYFKLCHNQGLVIKYLPLQVSLPKSSSGLFGKSTDAETDTH